LTKSGWTRYSPAMGRPPLTEDQVQAKVEAYCRRYDVPKGPDGLPPFPTGKRETRQHREWLTVYRALQRFRQRAAAEAPPPAEASSVPLCPICARPLEPALSVPYARRARSARPVPLHPNCAELVRLGENLGPGAVAALGPFLWPRRR
jgi:hypothetical protein